MKIGILTHQLLGNCGGILQNFALQEVLRNMGHKPITIDYTKPLPLRIKILSVIKRYILRLCSKTDSPLRGWPTKSEEKQIYYNPRTFVSQYIETTEQVKLANIGIFNGQFDAIIIGSDQVWRYAYMGQDIKHFFGWSLPKIPIKVAYAASFGTDEWEMQESLTKYCKEYVQNFRAISVREDSGVEMCRKYLDVQACHVLDPTLLVSSARYSEIIDSYNDMCYQNEKDKLVTYILDNTKEKMSIVEHISHIINVDAMPIAVKEFCKVGNVKECIIPPIERWLKGIRDARFVITDSFHGTAFSIIFNKPFVTICNNSRGASRMTSLLKIFNLENRLVSGFDKNEVQSILKEDIDWKRVNSMLEGERQSSLGFLNKSLK